MILEKPVAYTVFAESFDSEGEPKTVYGIRRSEPGRAEVVYCAVSPEKEKVLWFAALLEDYGADERSFKYLVEDFIA